MFTYFMKHWNGQLTLPISYWVNGIILSTILVYSIACVFGYTVIGYGVGYGVGYSAKILLGSYLSHATLVMIVEFVIKLIMLFFMIPIKVWTLIGIWRSAEKYTGRKIWKVLAEIAVVLGWFYLILGTIISFIP